MFKFAKCFTNYQRAVTIPKFEVMTLGPWVHPHSGMMKNYGNIDGSTQKCTDPLNKKKREVVEPSLLGGAVGFVKL